MSSSTRRVSILDSIFLYGETPNTMMHVAALLRVTPPAGATPDYLRTLVDQAKEHAVVQPPWNRRLKHPAPFTTPLQAWVEEPVIDLDYHVRRSALASPGDERELGILVSRLHSNRLDLSRPPWEMHLIEGLADGQFAIYVKIHHALIDGYTGMKLLQRSLPADPDDLDTPMMFDIPPAPRRPRHDSNGDSSHSLIGDTLALVAGAGRGIGGGATTAAQLGGRVGRLVHRTSETAGLIGPWQAPKTLLNRRIGRNRRFATQQFSLPELKELGKACGATVNDVALSVLGGGLRRFLDELGGLPEKPLIAFVPVNIRPEGDAGGGNAVGAILASLGTDHADPVARLDAVAASTRAGKAQLQGMSQTGMIAYSGYLLSPVALQAPLAVAGVRPPRLAFNVIVSNVPGPKETRYFRGGRVEAMFPVSIPMHGVALNITFKGYADTLNFGFVGDRDVVPHLQRLAVYTGEALTELRDAVGADTPH